MENNNVVINPCSGKLLEKVNELIESTDQQWNMMDQWYWQGTNNGVYIVRSGYEVTWKLLFGGVSGEQEIEIALYRIISLAPTIGPLGLSPKKIGEDIAKQTAKEWKGLRVTVKLTVQNRQAKVSVIPSAAALVIKALKEPESDQGAWLYC
ncbi:hypothetical protein ACFE04_011311 [Oxalis oulophora]